MVRRLLLLVLLVGCTQAQPLEEQIGMLELACNACEVITSATLTVDGTFYTTGEAVCLRRGNRLTCGSCQCALEPYETVISGERTCVFTPGNGTLQVSC